MTKEEYLQLGQSLMNVCDQSGGNASDTPNKTLVVMTDIYGNNQHYITNISQTNMDGMDDYAISWPYVLDTAALLFELGCKDIIVRYHPAILRQIDALFRDASQLLGASFFSRLHFVMDTSIPVMQPSV